MKKSLFVVWTLWLMQSCSPKLAPAADPEITTFILVRHAEKVLDGSKNPPLTPEGQERAALLASMLSASGVGKVYSTDYLRTLSTVKPFADQAGLTIVTYDPKAEPAFWEKNIAENKGKTVLVCGHSNSIPTLAGLLSGQKGFTELDESIYNKMYVVSVTGLGKGKVSELRYGRAPGK